MFEKIKIWFAAHKDEIIRQIQDQALHLVWIFAAFKVAFLIGGLWGGLLGAFIFALGRELVDQRKKIFPIFPIGWRKLLDIAFLTIAGLLAGL